MTFRPWGTLEGGRTLELAFSAQRSVAPLVARVRRYDRKLAGQLHDATNSFVLNVGEGSGSDPGNRRSRYFTASGSTKEVVSGLRASVGWGYLSAQSLALALSQRDRLLASLKTDQVRPGGPPLAIATGRPARD